MRPPGTNTDDDDRTSSWTAPSMWAPVTGHMAVAIVKVPVVIVVCMGVSGSPALRGVTMPMIVQGALLLTAVNISVTVVVERWFVLRRRSMVPGGWDFALLPWLAGAASAFGIASTALPMPSSLVLATVMTAVETAELAWSRPWRPGETDEEFHEKWVKAREMTKETFAPDVAEIRRGLEERAMEGYRRKIAERERAAEMRRQEDGRRPHP
jgi:hypothetical protein